MADALDVKSLLLQVDASVELLRRNLILGDAAVENFERKTQARLDRTDGRFGRLGTGLLGFGRRLIGINDQAGASFKRLEGRVEASSSRMEGSLRNAATAVAALFAVDQLFAVSKRALAYASSLAEVAEQLGVTAEQLQVFRYAGSQAGLTNDELDQGLRKLTQSLGQAATGAAGPTKALSLLGFSVEELRSGTLTAGDALPRLADAIAKIESPTQRAAVAGELFGNRFGQKMLPLLSGGSAAIDSLTKAAKELGVVLSDDDIQNADDAADKLAAVKQVLEANIARVVAQNAQAIVGLATSLAQLTGEIVKFLNSNPRVALGIIGALAGARIGGLPGAAIGAFGGIAAGNYLNRSQRDADMSIGVRTSEFFKAQRAYDQALRRPQRNGGGSFREGGSATLPGPTIAEAKAELDRQQALYSQATRFKGISDGKAAAPAPGLAGIETLNAGAAKAPKAPRAGPKGPTDADRLERFERAFAQLQDDELDLRIDLQTELGERAALEAEKLTIAHQSFVAEQDELVAANQLTRKQADALILLSATNTLTRKGLVTRELTDEVLREELDTRRAELDLADDALRDRLDLAKTAGERRAIELQLLDNALERLRLGQEEILASKTATQAEKARAQAILDSIPAKREAGQRSIDAKTAGPGRQLLDDVTKTADEINEDLENIAVEGLKSLNGELASAIEGTQSLGDAFSNVAEQIIADLLRIAIQQAIIKPIAGALFGPLGFADGGIIPGFAGGGILRGPGTGRSDSMLIRASTGEGILTAEAVRFYGAGLVGAINAKQLPRFADGGIVGPRLPRLNGVASAGFGTQRVRLEIVEAEGLALRVRTIAADTSVEVVRQTAPAVTEAAAGKAIAALQRRTL